MPDYIPSSDADLSVWVNQFMMALQSHITTLGLTQTELAALDTARDRWNDSLTTHGIAQAAAASAIQAKQQARDDYVRLLRTLVQRIQAHPAIQDSHRASLGITVRERTRTQAPAPSTRPVAQVDTSQRLRHTINFTDETTPTRRAKPEGVQGCEIWGKVSEQPPSNPSELSFLALDTASPYIMEYEGKDAGKIAHYMLRWINTRGEKGPWSQTVSATITA